MNRGKTIGLLLLLAGVGICLLTSAFMGSGIYTHKLTIPGAVLGLVLFGGLPLLVLGGLGVYFLVQGRAEERAMASVKKQERLLGMIKAHGQVRLEDAMLELHMTREEVTNAIYELVNLGLFAGYIDWDAMIFYSEEASKIATNKCPNCGGIREFVGKGIVKCPYCGVSIFIPPDAPQTRAEPKPPPGWQGPGPASGEAPPSGASGTSGAGAAEGAGDASA